MKRLRVYLDLPRVYLDLLRVYFLGGLFDRTILLSVRVYFDFWGYIWIGQFEGLFGPLELFCKSEIISFKHLKKISNFLKLQGCGSKIELATPISILKFKWMWQAWFLSHDPVTLKKYVSFIDKQMILVPFFDISNHIFVN